MNATTHMGELLPGSLPTVASKPRDMALACCRDLELCFGPLAVPPLPTELVRFTAGEVFALLARHDNNERVEEHERGDLGNARRWRLARSGVLHENTARLRSAFWAQAALRDSIQDDPEEKDFEARQFLPLLQQYLASEWRLWQGVSSQLLVNAQVSGETWGRWVADGVAPQPLRDRTALANLHAWLWQRAATFPHRHPTQEHLL